MYTRPVIYKVFSIFMLVAAAIVLTSGTISFVSLVFLNNGIKGITFDSVAAEKLATAMMSGVFVSTLISALMYFLEFVYFASFSRFVNHMKNDNNSPLPKNTTLIPTSFIKVLGIILFVVQVISLLSVLGLFIALLSMSVSGFLFAFLTTLVVVLFGFIIALYYIHYVLRFGAFDATVKVAAKTKAADAERMRLIKYNSNIPRGMCTLLWYLTIGVFILPIAILIVLVFIKAEAAAVQFLAKIYIWFPSLIVFGLVAGVYSCMYDNLAMAMEHEKIKYRLI